MGKKLPPHFILFIVLAIIFLKVVESIGIAGIFVFVVLGFLLLVARRRTKKTKRFGLGLLDYLLTKARKETHKEKYRRYLKSDAWKQKSSTILKMAGYRCRVCGQKATQVHHETYARVFSERLTDLTALCSSCHQDKHDLF